MNGVVGPRGCACLFGPLSSMSESEAAPAAPAAPAAQESTGAVQQWQCGTGRPEITPVTSRDAELQRRPRRDLLWSVPLHSCIPEAGLCAIESKDPPVLAGISAVAERDSKPPWGAGVLPRRPSHDGLGRTLSWKTRWCRRGRVRSGPGCSHSSYGLVRASEQPRGRAPPPRQRNEHCT